MDAGSSSSPDMKDWMLGWDEVAVASAGLQVEYLKACNASPSGPTWA